MKKLLPHYLIIATRLEQHGSETIAEGVLLVQVLMPIAFASLPAPLAQAMAVQHPLSATIIRLTHARTKADIVAVHVHIRLLRLRQKHAIAMSAELTTELPRTV